jgi:HK97 family phage major capsid protein
MTLKSLQKRASRRDLSTDRPGPHAVNNSQGPFSTFAEQLFAIKRAYTSGSWGWTDPRLLEVNRRGEQRGQPAGASEMIPADGGFLIQPDFSADIQRRMTNVGEIFRRCRQVPITSDSYKYCLYDEQSRVTGSRWGGLRTYWVNEADQATKSKPRLLLSEIKTNKLIGLLEASDELTRDANNYAEQMTDAFAEEICWMVENCVINGTGQDQLLGILNSPALITVPKQSGQASQSIIYNNVEGMASSFWAKSWQSEGALWLYNQSALSQLAALTTIVGVAGSESKAWIWAPSVEDDDMLLGIPAVMCEYCPSLGNSGDLLLVDCSRYLLVVRELLRTEMSLHVLWLQDEACFRVVCRIGGQPLDHTPVSPANGSASAKTSPFVCLAQR